MNKEVGNLCQLSTKLKIGSKRKGEQQQEWTGQSMNFYYILLCIHSPSKIQGYFEFKYILVHNLKHDTSNTLQVRCPGKA